MRVAVVGAGSWGTALAHTLALEHTEHEVVLSARNSAVAAEIERAHRNPRYLTEVSLCERIVVTSDTAAAVRGAAIVVLAVPTSAVRQVASAAASALDEDAVVVSAAKGFEERSGASMSTVLTEVLETRRIVALSGPNIALEVARGLPAASVVGGPRDCADLVRDSLTGNRLRLYSTDDRVGVEFAGALKNIIAIAAGACDGIGAGDNGKAAIMTRGLAEMARLGVSAGASLTTFAGLAGIGDCVTTCISPYSRNRRLGQAIAQGAQLDHALTMIGEVVEGVNATRVALRLAREHAVDMPITREVHEVLFQEKSVTAALGALMERDPADETRGLSPV